MKDMTKMFDMEQLKDLYNVENIKEVSEKNLDSCRQASDVLIEGMNEYSKRQAELTRECVEASVEAVKDVATAKTVDEFVSKQQDVLNEMVARNTKVVKELTGIMQESQDKVASLFKAMMNVK